MNEESPTAPSGLQAAALPRGDVHGHVRRQRAAAVLLFLPLVAYLGSVWLVRPVPVSLVSPALLLLSPLAITISRRFFLGCLRKLSVEFTLLAVMLVLSVLSIANSDDPVRTIRIIFPCVLPFILFAHLTTMGFVSRDWLLLTPRLLLATAAIFSLAPFLASFVLPPLEDFVYGSYRLKCFFENSIQHAIALGVLVPVAATELALAKTRKRRILWGAVIFLLAFTLFRTGSKTAMFVSLSSGTLLFVLLRIHAQNVAATVVMLACLGAAVVFLAIFGLDIAEELHPKIGAKIRSIVEGGVANYHSIDSRQLLWEEAMAKGRENWLIGSGAGEKVLGISHAHNLVLDYFKGIGIFGAAAIALLCLSIFARMLRKAVPVLRGIGDDNDKRILACYVGASIYVVLNQLSDSFGPSTIAFLWIVYLAGVLADRPPPRKTAMPPASGGGRAPAMAR